MKSSSVLSIAACVAGILSVMPMALAQTPAKPAAPATGETLVASAKRTATVTKIDHKTRAVTLKADNGLEYSFVASDDVKNLAQVHKGDLVTATFMEALAYEVTKGGKAAGVGTTAAAGAAQPGAKPAGVIARQTTLTATITAIDPKVPSVTFKGPAGNIRTIKVMHPEKLQGVSVGDTVDISYTEAIAIEVEKAPKK